MAQKMNVTVSDELKAWLEEESRKTGIPQSTLIIIGFKSYVDQQRMLDMTRQMDVITKMQEELKRQGISAL